MCGEPDWPWCSGFLDLPHGWDRVIDRGHSCDSNMKSGGRGVFFVAEAVVRKLEVGEEEIARGERATGGGETFAHLREGDPDGRINRDDNQVAEGRRVDVLFLVDLLQSLENEM